MKPFPTAVAAAQVQAVERATGHPGFGQFLQEEQLLKIKEEPKNE